MYVCMYVCMHVSWYMYVSICNTWLTAIIIGFMRRLLGILGLQASWLRSFSISGSVQGVSVYGRSERVL